MFIVYSDDTISVITDKEEIYDIKSPTPFAFIDLHHLLPVMVSVEITKGDIVAMRYVNFIKIIDQL